MATVIAVHGTFAHVGGSAEALNIDSDAGLQWWQPESEFDGHIRELVEGEDGKLDIVPFSWSSDNSELSRREAGSRLLKDMRALDAAGETYTVVGHSHGGSVISAALVESVARGEPLSGLKKWISVGTPFVALQRERFLFTRLSLTRQVMFVASLMLLGMFAFYMVGEIFDSTRRIATERLLWISLVSGLMMSLPFIALYIYFRFSDRKKLFSYGPRVIARAQEAYGSKWASLCHEDDEAVHGLKFLPNVNVKFFEKNFAVSTLTMAAVFVLPLAYLFVVTNPPIMRGIAEFLKSDVYGVEEYKSSEDTFVAAQKARRKVFRDLRKARRDAERPGLDAARGIEARKRAKDLRQRLREMRRNLEETYPEYASIQRSLRFKRRFLQRNGTPCDGNTLCGGGRDFALNSKLIYHVVTDELSHAIVDDDFVPGFYGSILRLAIPIILVPIVFGILALGILSVIRFVANHLSDYLSRWLNRLTLAELRRSAYGNDTEGEIALAADYRPTWISPGYRHLPADVGDRIAEASNAATYKSLSKFRNAISTLAFSEGEGTRSGLISEYLSWKELIHTSYFDVPEFRKLVARVISDTDGFSPTEKFRSDPDYQRTGNWIAGLAPKPDGDDATAVAAGKPSPAAPFPA
jgi:hypothetical protein